MRLYQSQQDVKWINSWCIWRMSVYYSTISGRGLSNRKWCGWEPHSADGPNDSVGVTSKSLTQNPPPHVRLKSVVFVSESLDDLHFSCSSLMCFSELFAFCEYLEAVYVKEWRFLWHTVSLCVSLVLLTHAWRSQLYRKRCRESFTAHRARSPETLDTGEPRAWRQGQRTPLMSVWLCTWAHVWRTGRNTYTVSHV